MNYVSIGFLCFTAVCFILYYLIPQKFRPYVLLAASAVFYILFSKHLIIVSAALTLLVYFVSVRIGKIDEEFSVKKKELSKEERKAEKNRIKSVKKRLSAVECTVAFVMLAVFKYLGFFTETVNNVMSVFTQSRIPVVSLIMPVGISYFTLSVVAYAVDVYRGAVKPEKNFAKLYLFTIYFPHIVEGPIGNYQSFSTQLNNPKKLTYESFMSAFELILLGLVKKMILADRAGIVSSYCFDNYSQFNSVSAFFGMVLYAINIYFDFSGCMDIVCGISELFGIKLPENFRQPFFSKSVQEFWRRWHITLGDWIKKYIFYPVSMSGTSKIITKLCISIKSDYLRITVPTLFSLLFVWLFTGIWHGASWKYILYGMYYYVILLLGLLLEPVFEKICLRLRIDRQRKRFSAFRIIRTDILVVFGLALFRADSVSDYSRMMASLFDFSDLSGRLLSLISSNSLSLLDFAVIAVFTAAMLFISVKKESGADIRAKLESNKKLRWVLCTAAIIFIVALGVYGPSYTEQPFVYAQF